MHPVLVLLPPLAVLAVLVLLPPLAAASPPDPFPPPDPSPDPSPAAAPQPRLLFVAELCRHGDRTPLAHFPSDALPAPEWPEGVGQLTALGQRAHYQLGNRLRHRYVNRTRFLPPVYSPAHVYVRSTDIDRTLMSAIAQLAGLYPPGTAPNADVRVRFGAPPLAPREGGLPHRFQPVPVHTHSQDNDLLLLPDRNCPRQQRNLRRMYNAPEFRNMLRREHHFLHALATIANRDPHAFTVWDAARLSDTWTVFQHHSVPLPERATPHIVAHATNLSNWLVTYVNQGLQQNRLRAGLILYTVRQYIAMAALHHQRQLPPEFHQLHKKFVLLSAHDTTVAAALSALQVFDGVNPPYNSTLIWEFYAAPDNNYFVKLEYNGKPLLLPGCSNLMCPILEYVQSTARRTLQGEFDKTVECAVGFIRLARFVQSWFRKPQPDQHLLNLAFPPDDHDHQSPPALVSTVISLVCAVALLLGAAGIISRVRSRYSGYVRASDASLDAEYRQPIMHDVVSDRRILM